ncbi:TetR family transcriptional regulator [Robertmurraya siralis]|uniref:TetR family transcriptional regulator n=1 Tax=Robertmurraya siralis TaxID=77777 RepID=A0A919WE60_9BACI|nr:forespore capture DNA-binding protein RefZ [Robertmurraya siralis]PAE18402.1 TetR family transcriptional regulator [Bacillus sp. 7504-2]GIN60119.1 TetR family transcriptional regulator [Robertmurraya siralis]
MVQNTKNDILEAAILLFNTKGFTGTSIRDIAGKARVNVSNISYYFQSKEGLLEHCLTTYFEQYLQLIEEGYYEGMKEGALSQLQHITEKILHFHCQHIHLTRLVLREISIDSQMVREVMATYILKERYYLKLVFEEGIRSKEFQSFSVNYMLIQYKSLITMPFLNSYYLTEVLQVLPNERYFVKRYLKDLNGWFQGVICRRPSPNLSAANN